MLVKNARLATCGPLGTFEGWIWLEGGAIRALGVSEPPAEAGESFDAGGRWVIPGLIDCQTALGLKSLEYGPDWDAEEHTEPVTPELRAIDALNPLDVGFDEAVAGGVTTVYTGPGDGSVLAGQGMVLKTHGQNLCSRLIYPAFDLKATLGSRPKTVFGEKKQSPATRMAVAGLIRESLQKARDRLAKAEDIADPRTAALAGALDGTKPVRFHAHRADDILTALRISREFSLRPLIEHGTEAHLVIPEILKHGVPVIAGPALAAGIEPEMKNHDAANIKTLVDAGVTVALTTDHPSVPIHYLLVCAALVHAEGVSLEDTLKTLTVNPARILGLDKRLGSLEPGKDADLIVLSGHPFDITTRVDLAFVSGSRVLPQVPSALLERGSAQCS